jgi:hypothetical protein
LIRFEQFSVTDLRRVDAEVLEALAREWPFAQFSEKIARRTAGANARMPSFGEDIEATLTRRRSAAAARRFGGLLIHILGRRHVHLP